VAIEFHDVDIVTETFNSLVEKLKRDFYIVPIHINNMGGMAPFHFPTAPEITFLNKRFYNSIPSPSRLEYPVAGLDRPIFLSNFHLRSPIGARQRNPSNKSCNWAP
jgi:hypothetical protein